MSNMSYCRFQNTLNDLRDCADALEEMVNDPSAAPLSREELSAAKQLIGQCFGICALIAERAGDCEIEDLDDDRRVSDVVDAINAECGQDEEEDDDE